MTAVVAQAELTATDDLPLVTVLIPAFNEALKIEASLTAIHGYMVGLSDNYRFEVVVVDDGSTDKTLSIAQQFAASNPEVRVYKQPANMRIGQVLRDGFAISRGDVVITFDSDLSYSVSHIGRMLEAMATQHVDIVVASPYMVGGQTTAIPWRRAVMSKQVNRMLAATSQYDIRTVTGMVRAYRGPFIRALSLKSMGPEINTEIMYKAQVLRARVAEVPAHLDWSDQAERMAKRKVSLSVRLTSKLLVFASFLFRPIWFFLLPGLLLFAISLWSAGSLFITVLREARHLPGGIDPGGIDGRLTNGFAHAWKLRPQTFIIAGFSFIIAVQLITLGVLAAQAKRYFEELFFALSKRNRASGADQNTVGPEWVDADRVGMFPTRES